MRTRLVIVLTILSTALSSLPAQAQVAYVVEAPPPRTSVFKSAYRGLLTGSFTGLGTGYLVTRDAGIGGDDWRTLLLATGIGALSGSALGLSLGLVDLADDTPGLGSIAMRDTLYGTVFGGIAGAIAGGLFVLKTGDGENAALGAAVGTVSGTGLGLIIGVLEGSRASTRLRQPLPVTAPGRVTVTIGAAQDAAHHTVWTPALAGRF